MTRAPAFQDYANEELARRLGMSLAANGATDQLKRVMWSQSEDQCSLLDDDKLLANRSGAPSLEVWLLLREEIFQPDRRLFVQKDGRIISLHLKEQAAKQRKYRKLQAEKSKKGVAARVTRGSPAGSSTGEARVTSSTPISSPTSEKKDTHKTCVNGHADHVQNKDWEESFIKFWAAFPKKIHKAGVENWFATNHPSTELVEEMLVTIDAFKKTAGWQKDKGQYVPDPLKWLNDKRWTDVARVDVPPKRRIILT
jgi:hypothetical protein